MTLVMKKQSSSEACSECGVIATSLFFRGKTVGGRGLLLISSTFFFNFFSQCQLGGCPQQHLEVKDRGRGVCVTTNIGIICLKGHRRLMGQKKEQVRGMEIGTPLRCPCLKSDISVTSLLLGDLNSQVQSVWQLCCWQPWLLRQAFCRCCCEGCSIGQLEFYAQMNLKIPVKKASQISRMQS